MKITPLEIRQKTFEKKLRGYDKDEVNAFLLSLSQEWENVQDQLKELKIKFQSAENEIKQLREVESSLFKTLKTAEDTGANMIDQATKTAELHLRETQMNADALLNEAKSKARASIEEADLRARQIMDKLEGDIQMLTMDYKSLENLRDIIISELRNLSNDTLNRVEKIAANSKNVDVKKEAMAARKNVEKMVAEKEIAEPAPIIEVEKTIEEPVEEDSIADEPEANAESVVSDSDDSEDSSFFDKIQ